MIEGILHPKSEKKVCRICLSGSKRLWKQVGWSVNQTFEPANQGCGNTLQRIFLGFTLQTKFLFCILRCQSRVWQKIKNNLWVFLSSYPAFRIFDWKVEHLKDRIEVRRRFLVPIVGMLHLPRAGKEHVGRGEGREAGQGRTPEQAEHPRIRRLKLLLEWYCMVSGFILKGVFWEICDDGPEVLFHVEMKCGI